MTLEKHNLYRFPWSKNDNPIAWLEVTDICNLHCEGCYRQRLTGHKPLEQVKEEILFFKRWRNPDNVSIAGGEPLLHPQILDIVACIAEHGIKPIVLTNADGVEDLGHGLCISHHDINFGVSPQETASVTFKAKHKGVFWYYCPWFCHALHLEMRGRMIVT